MVVHLPPKKTTKKPKTPLINKIQVYSKEFSELVKVGWVEGAKEKDLAMILFLSNLVIKMFCCTIM